MGYVEFDMSSLRAFCSKLDAAGKGGVSRQIKLWLEAIGIEFLRILQDEIIRLKVVDTRLLLSSFQVGDDNSVWTLSEKDLTLEVGTNVEYASYVNDGHWTCKQGEKMRFVPGRWDGSKFIYDPSSNTGMVLKQKWVDGRFYWESALVILEKLYPQLLERKLQQWLDSLFED